MPKTLPLYHLVKHQLGVAIFKNSRVLEFGCKNFKDSIAMGQMGAQVTAIDTSKQFIQSHKIRFVQSDFLRWKPYLKCDIAYCSNISFFTPTRLVQQKLAELKPKIIAVRGVYIAAGNWPEYVIQPADWINYFEPKGYKTFVAKEYIEKQTDIYGKRHKFIIVDFIAEQIVIPEESLQPKVRYQIYAMK